MNCSALGSLCSSLCESFSFTWNCSKTNNLVIIGEGKFGPELENRALIDVIANLREQQAPTLSLKAKTVRRLHREDTSIDSNKICQGIAETVNDLCNQLTLVTEPHMRGWQKLRLAQAYSGIDLEEKYRKKEPLGDDELTVLTEAIQKVSQFYLTAVFFWRLGKQRNFKKDRLDLVTQAPLKKSMDYLKKNLKTVEKRRLREPDNFFELDRNIQVTYLESAFLAEPALLAAILVNGTLSENAVVIPHEGGSSQLRHRVLDHIRIPEPVEIKRSESQEYELDNIVARIQQHRPKTQSTGSFTEVGLENMRLLRGGDSPPEQGEMKRKGSQDDLDNSAREQHQGYKNPSTSGEDALYLKVFKNDSESPA